MGQFTELAEEMTEYTKSFKTVPTILVCGETHDLCSCDEVATKSVVYERDSIYHGIAYRKRFEERICDSCFHDRGYMDGKVIISISPYDSNDI
jgi:hypothetical protein